MRIVLTTQGSTGDFIPFFALARRLIARGHAARLLGHDQARDYAAEFGVPYGVVGTPVETAALRERMDRVLDRNNRLAEAREVVRALILEDAGERYRDMREAMAEAELAVCHSFDPVAHAAAEDAGLPWASVTLCPDIIPNRQAPPAGLPDLGSWLTCWQWRLVERMLRGLNAEIEDVVAEVSGRRRPLRAGANFSPWLNLVAASPVLAPVYPDRVPGLTATGPWQLPAPGFRPAPGLADFLAHPEPPVVISFGSMTTGETNRLGPLLIEAVSLSGRRAVIQRNVLLGRGYGDWEARADPGRILFVDFVPHDYLFARAACVVHHCGAGTTTAACRAGVPSVAVPHMFDQFYWAARLHKLGAAPRPLPWRRLGARRLATRIREAVENPDHARAARALAAGLAGEDGTGRAVSLLEERFGGGGR